MIKEQDDKFNQGEDPAPGAADHRYAPEDAARFDSILDRVKETMANEKAKAGKK